MRITQATCKFCGTNYAYLLSGQWSRGTKDRRRRSSTLCPDCFEKVTTGIMEWCKKRSHREWNLFVEKLYKRGLSDQAILAVLIAIDEVCTICWDGDKDCVCSQDI